MNGEGSQHPHELISAFADGETSVEEAGRVQEHLRGCSECRQLLHDLRRISTAVGEEAVPPPPDNLAGRIRARLETGLPAKPSAKTASFWRSPFPLATAATLLLVSVVWIALRREPPPSRISPAPPAPQAAPEAEIETPLAAKDTGVDRPKASMPESGIVSETVTGNREDRLSKVDSRSAAGPPPEEKNEDVSAKARELERALDELGYVESPPSNTPAGGAAEGAQEEGLESEFRRKPKVSRQAGAAAGVPVGKVLKESLQEAPQESPRSFVYEGPDFSATFTEDGLVTLVARGYACSVTVPPPPTSPQAGAGRAVAVEDLLTLFATAGSRGFLYLPAPLEETDAAGASEAPRPTSSLALRDGEGDPIRTVPFTEPLPVDSPQALRTLRQGVQFLVQERYRKELEARCGTIPAGILSTSP